MRDPPETERRDEPNQRDASTAADVANRRAEGSTRGASLRARLRAHPARTAVAAVVLVGAGTFAGRVALRLARGAIRRVTGADAVDIAPSPERAPPEEPDEP